MLRANGSIRAILALIAATVASGGVSVHAQAAESRPLSTNIADYVCSNLDSFTAIMHVVHFDDAAGRKINKDFGMIYKLKGDVKLTYKEQNKLRLDAHIGAARATLVVNGARQEVRLPTFGIHTTSNLGESPGKRKTLLDVGLISSGYLAYTEAQYLRTQPVDGVPCAVFDVSYRDKHLDTSHRTLWIDPRTKVVVKREEYSQVGKLNAIYYYQNATQVAPGIWFPGRIDVVNNQGEEAGVTAYRDVKVNCGVPDSAFRL